MSFMKIGVRITSFLVAMVCLFSCLSIFPAFAEPATVSQSSQEGGTYKKKIVSVLYDDSGSMLSGQGYEYALYALQMLMSMLSERDYLVIVPMNASTNVEVSLSSADRNAAIQSALGKIPGPSGGTPSTSIGKAVQALTVTDKGFGGLKNQDNLALAAEDEEYWLIVLTDGGFENNTTEEYIARKMNYYTSDYPSLNKIYLGVGAAVEMQNSTTSANYVPNLYPYKAETSAKMISSMLSISNLLSGRYSLDPQYYTASGSTVTVNLPSDYSFKTLSVIAQNCGATLVSAKYNGNNVSLSNASVITPHSNLASAPTNMKNGYSATMVGDPYFLGGTLTLTFSGEVSKDNLAILAEPALRLEMYLKKSNGTEATMDEINATCKPGNTISVGYRVYDYYKSTEVDINTLFGTKVESVSYAGQTYGIGQPITLVKGNYAITVSVSVMNASYTMYHTLMCFIQENPTYYRVDMTGQSVDAATRKAQATFTVYVDNAKVTNWSDSKVDGFTQTATVKDSSGKTTNVKLTQSGGSFVAAHTHSAGEYGKFTMTFTVQANEAYGYVKRTASYDYELKPSTVELVEKSFPDTFSGSNATLTLTVKTDGTELSKTLLDKYGVTATAKITDPNGKSSTVNATVGSDGKISIPVASTGGVFGDYKVDISVKSSIFAEQKISHTVSCPPTSGSGTTVTLTKGNCAAEFDGSKNAQLEFSLKANGTALTKEQVEKFYDLTVKVTSPDGAVNTVTPTVASDGKIMVTAIAESGKFGDYGVTVTATLKGNASEKYEATHSVTYEAAALELEQGSVVDKFDNSGKVQLDYVVKVDGKPLTKDELDQYTLTCKLTDPDGNTVDVTPTVGSDGKIALPLEAVKGLYGEYTLVFTVTSTVDESVTATANVTLLFELAPIEIKQEHDALITSPALSAQLTYKVYMEGKQMMQSDLEGNFAWALKLIDPKGNETPLELQVSASGALTATVNVPEGDYGGYIAQFVLTLPDGSEMTAEPHTVHYHPASVEIKGEQKGELGNGVKQVGFEHTVSINGTQLTPEDLNRYDWKLEAIAPGDRAVSMGMSIDDNGLITSSLDVTATGFGKYLVKLTVTLCEDLVEEHTFELKFYPVSMTVSVADGNGTSITQHQMTYNDKAIKFELTADGSPFYFDNGLTTHKVLVDGQDVTAYTTLEGNILSYAPHADHFGGGEELPVGERTVTIRVDCADMPTLTTNTTATFSVTPTVYEVVSLDTGNKSVDRFWLGQVDAALYFQVVRDGIPLSLEELKSEWESGKIKLSDTTGTFGWQFWLPVGSETTVEELDGQPVIAFRVTQDWIKPFDSYAAMLIFDGDKAVTVSYHGVTGSDAITFGPSGAWSYIWRILVILLIIHTILYCIGFFTCKALPSGYFVSTSVGTATFAKVNFKVNKKVNIGWKDLFMWHLLRFVPNPHGYLFYNQPAVTCSSATLATDKKSGTAGLYFKAKNVYRIVPLIAGDFDEQLSKFKNDLKKFHGKGKSPMLSAKATDVKNTLGKPDMADSPMTPGERCSGYDMYGKFDMGGNLTNIIFFIAVL